jgi:hypothetical protein
MFGPNLRDAHLDLVADHVAKPASWCLGLLLVCFFHAIKASICPNQTLSFFVSDREHCSTSMIQSFSPMSTLLYSAYLCTIGIPYNFILHAERCDGTTRMSPLKTIWHVQVWTPPSIVPATLRAVWCGPAKAWQARMHKELGNFHFHPNGSPFEFHIAPLSLHGNSQSQIAPPLFGGGTCPSYSTLPPLLWLWPGT